MIEKMTAILNLNLTLLSKLKKTIIPATGFQNNTEYGFTVPAGTKNFYDLVVDETISMSQLSNTHKSGLTATDRIKARRSPK